MSLDGYIAGPKGESDWIVMDPEIDFGVLAMANLLDRTRDGPTDLALDYLAQGHPRPRRTRKECD